MAENGFYIFCDESVKSGKYFSNFYGGVLMQKSDYNWVNNLLLSKKQDLGMEDSELKWTQVNSYRLESYCEIMDLFFELIQRNVFKVRIMFTDNRIVSKDSSALQKQNEYHLLYYQFIKHAFGLSYLISDEEQSLELFFDVMPENNEKVKKFKNFIYGIQLLPEFVDTNLSIRRDAIKEVDSKKHIILQCLDVVLGAMAFRLNHLHKAIPKGKKRRGKRTVAKEKVYKHINRLIQNTRPNFNIGVSTGLDGNAENRFFHSYRHWLFVPKSHEYIARE